MKDNFLMEQIEQKNEIVFKSCYDMYFEELVIYANSYLFNYHVSEDIVQEVFIYIWQNSGSINIKVSLKSYLFVMVKNRSLNYLKSLKVTDVKNFIELSNSLISDVEIEKSSLENQNTSYLKIIEIVNKMPSKMQRIFRLKFIEDYKYKEIASELNISINTVKTQLKRAKIKISESLMILLIWLLNY